MIAQYVEAVAHALGSVLNLMTRLALPLALFLGLTVMAGALIFALRRDDPGPLRSDWRRWRNSVLGYGLTACVIVTGWAVLRVIHPMARQDIEWRESAEATANPVPDAPAVQQYGPAVAAIRERTYTRTLTLPPDFLQRVGEQGVGVLAPYLSDPSAQNVLKLVDTFRQSGQDVVFTRAVTRLDEEPIPFSNSNVRVRFKRLAGRAYDADFEGRYAFRNATNGSINARFSFPLPQAGTVRDLDISVGSENVTETGASGAYEWKGELQPGEQREAVVRYHVTGARTWHYDLGSQRRRVERFHLDVASGGSVRFLRGSLQPSATSGNTLRWELGNVVTEQQVGLAFPPDIVGRDSYLQSLTALPACFILFALGLLATGWRFRQPVAFAPLASGLVLFAFGLTAVPVLANYLGPTLGVILGPLLGTLLAVRVLGPCILMAGLPVALMPTAFLSPTHSGLIVLIIAAIALVLLLPPTRTQSSAREML